MQGLMMDRPLMISSIIDHAALYHGDTQVVSRSIEGPIHRYTYRDVGARARQVAGALATLGVKPGDRIGTVAWNGYRHLELYYGVSGMGAVLHTINPRLFPEQLVYIVNHAEDSHLFVDLTFVPLLEKLADQFETVKSFVIMTDEAHMPDTTLDDVVCYETLIGAESPDYVWPEFDEHLASSLCYTSGTTGNPKGTLYSHRSTVLHAMAACASDVLGLSCRDTSLSIVPMFHANAWSLPYAAPMCGGKLVFPGARLDGASVYELIDSESVNFSAGVPTVWLMLLEYLAQSGHRLDGVVAGGVWRLGFAALNDQDIRREVRSPHDSGLGDDRDESPRHRWDLQERDGGAARRAAVRHSGEAGPLRLRCRDENRRRGGHRAAARRHGVWPAHGAGAVGRSELLP